MQLGLIAYWRGNLGGAERWYRKSLEIDERNGDERQAAATCHYLGAAAVIVDLTIAHAAAQTTLTGRGDPFDRLLAAQSMVDGLTVVSNDPGLDQYRIQRLW